MVESKYKALILRTVKPDEVMSTNSIRENLKKLAGVRYIEFNLIYRLLEQLEREGKVEKLRGPKRAFYWRKVPDKGE